MKDEIVIRSPLVLLEEDELAFYRERGLAVASLCGTPVRHGRRDLGTLRDVVIGAGSSVLEVVLNGDGEERRVPVDEALRFHGESSAA